MEATSTTPTDSHQGATHSSGGRGRGNKPRFDRGQKPQYAPRGAIEELRDNVYIVGDVRQAHKFTKTTEAILAYIQATYDEGMDVVDGLTKMEDPDFDKWKPEQPKPKIKATDTAAAVYDEFEKDEYRMEFKEWMERKKKYRINMDKVFAVLWGQCTLATKNKLESRKDWTTIKDGHRAIDLLQAIKEVTQDYQDNVYPIISVVNAIADVINGKQEEGQVAYTKKYRNSVEHMEAQAGPMTLAVYATKMEGYTKKKHEEFEKLAYDRVTAYCYLKGCNKAKYLLKDLANAFAMGNDNYPKTLNDAIAMVSNYQGNTEKKTGMRPDNRSDGEQTAVGFAQRGTQSRKLTCYRCGKEGHIATNCTNNQNTGGNDEATESNEESESQSTPTRTNVFMQAREENESGTGVGMHSTRAGPHTATLKNKILLDNQATDSTFCNEKFVTNIRKVNKKHRMLGNGGSIMEYEMQADLKGYPHPVWFNPKGMTNIISLSEVEKMPDNFKIEYETGIFKVVNKKSGKITEFKRDEEGLYTNTPMPNNSKCKQVKFAEKIEGVGVTAPNQNSMNEWNLVVPKKKRPNNKPYQMKQKQTKELSNRRQGRRAAQF